MLEKVTSRCDRRHSPPSEQISLVGNNGKGVLVRCKGHEVERMGVHVNLPNVKTTQIMGVWWWWGLFNREKNQTY